MFAYKRHGVSYVARPPPSIRPRKGLFKKASNLNYGLNVAIRVEEVMQESGGQVTDPIEVRLVSIAVCEGKPGGKFKLGRSRQPLALLENMYHI